MTLEGVFLTVDYILTMWLLL